MGTVQPQSYSRVERRNAGALRPVRILLLEDDPDVRLMLTLALRTEGYDVTPVTTADEALESLSRRRHDLILTDYWLPRKDGLQFLQEAQSRGVLAKAPVILCSAFPPARVGNATVVAKPIELDDLLGRIRRLLRR
ncbi:MAG TPA: response regulator [Vicinamibacterales bacterium]|jgi:DNA-binding response OmpR family regulator|nr:response regulator [Vicinamibacterales bacterium]